MNKFITALTASLLMTSAAAAGDESPTYENDTGKWKSYFFATDTSGTPMCGISTNLPDNKIFLLKLNQNGNIWGQVYNYNWHLKPEATAEVRIGFDKSWTFQATASLTSNDKNNALYWPIGADTIVGMRNLMQTSTNMWIAFPKGTEKPWRIGLTGAKEALDQLTMCGSVMLTLSAPLAPPTDVSSPVSRPRGEPL